MCRDSVLICGYYVKKDILVLTFDKMSKTFASFDTSGDFQHLAGKEHT